MKNNLDIAYTILTILVTIILMPFDFSFALTIGGLLSIIGVFFTQSYIGMKVFESRSDERAKYISNRAYSLAFNITLLTTIIISALIRYFNIAMMLEFFDIIVIVGWLSYSISLALYRRVY
ncbi:hypothetical protein [Anaeromicrobium sediminis]|uniref:Uncharacterized protein n=1 Tax=Anaeromicrobium sediminis TaxID=1478221 RepID=A0A267MEA9_9FIRM|nr:hypothetical protein [Anaeromicrobium sediminis]PAB57133.1 hypothetical protein CCE28_19580 [Anaeromicrobium sediminis]